MVEVKLSITLKHMKVRELISQLKYIDQEKEVFLGERHKRNKVGGLKTVYGDVDVILYSMTQFGVVDSVVLTGQIGSELKINQDK